MMAGKAAVEEEQLSSVSSIPAGQSTASKLPISIAACVALLLQAALYSEAFRVKPSGDDFGPPLTEIQRGEREGPASFFTVTPQANRYRPVQSLLMWVFGRWDHVPLHFSVRLLSFAAMAIFLSALVAWLQVLPVSTFGAVAAILLLTLHPVLVAPLASIDGFSTLLTAGIVWWGAWCIRERSARSRPVQAACVAGVFAVIGLLIKEYTLALLPLGVLTAMFFAPSGARLRSAGAIAAVLIVTVTAYFLLRGQIRVDDPTDVIPSSMSVETFPRGDVLDTYRERNDPTFHPKVLGMNTATLLAGILYFGNTTRVFVERDLPRFALVALSAALFLTLVGGGLLMARASNKAGTASWDVSASRTAAPRPVVRLASFFILAVFAATFPANVMGHISEMRIAAAVLPIAVLVAIAVTGWQERGLPIGSALLMVILLGWGGLSIGPKVHGIRDAGDRAETQLDQLRELLALRPEVKVVALLYPEPSDSRGSYSVFLVPDEALIGNAGHYGWFKPENVRWRVFVGQSAEAVRNTQEFDLILVWNSDTRQFLPAESLKAPVRRQPAATAAA